MSSLKTLIIIVILFSSMVVFAASEDSERQIHMEGLQALKSGDAKKAVALLTLALALNGLEPRYYYDRCVAHKRLGDMEKALADYTTAIKMKPHYAHALNNRGLLYLEQGKYDLAIGDFSEALKSGDLQSRLYTNMGLTKAQQGDYQGAIKDFDKAFSYQPMDHRSFLFMAESLEKTGDLEKALRTYKLARNLLTDPEAQSVIDSRIGRLATQKGVQQTYTKDTTVKPQGASQPLKPAKSTPLEKPRPQLREIARAQPFPDTNTQRQETNPSSEVLVDSYETLEKKSRNKALAKYSIAAREIYHQGHEFLSKADAAKALIRFEDACQLERRNKNVFGVAWGDIEIARVYKSLDDYVKAEIYLRDALRLFEAAKAPDQVILAILELADINKRLMEQQKTAYLYQMAQEKASALGYVALAKQISEMASGKKPAFEKKTAEPSSSAEESRQNRREVREPTSPPTGQVKEPRKYSETSKASGVVSSNQLERSSVARVSISKQKPQVVETRVQPELAYGQQSKINHERPLILRSPEQMASKHTPSAGGMREVISPAPPSADGTSQIKTDPGRGRAGKAKNEKSQLELPAPPAARHKALAQETNTVPKATNADAPINKNGPKEPSLQEDLVLLRELRARNDTRQMAPVLERLGRRYFRLGNFEKSDHAFSAAIDFREKLDLTEGIEALLEARAASRESLGNLAEALEDLARSLYLQQVRGKQPESHLLHKLTKLANALEIDRDAIVEAFQLLWNSRNKNDSTGELQAVLTIAFIYDRSGKLSQALTYYDRAAASVTANKAQILEKMGNQHLAQQHWNQALEALRNLDYSAYIHIIKQPKVVGAQAVR